MKIRNLLGPKERFVAAALAGMALVAGLAEMVLAEPTGGVAERLSDTPLVQALSGNYHAKRSGDIYVVFQIGRGRPHIANSGNR